MEINRRGDEQKVDKQNEALKVMPVLFDEAGFKVTVCDPPYANYQATPDLSIYDDYPEINRYNTEGNFNDPEAEKVSNALNVNTNMKKFFRFGVMKCLPVFLQPLLYKDGGYCTLAQKQEESEDSAAAKYTGQTASDPLTAEGISKAFMDRYNVLFNLENIAVATDNEQNTFLMFANEITHSDCILQEPAYEPTDAVDNAQYEAEHHDRFTLDGQTLVMETQEQYSSYQMEMAGLLQLGKWFDWMREQGVYDNTRIILVSDHGNGVRSLPQLFLDDTVNDELINERIGDMEFYYPLFMMKDFGSEGFTVSEDFMTNADTPTLAMTDIIEDPVNPFTGKAINADEKTAHDQYVLATTEDHFLLDANYGCHFLADPWYSVHDDMRDLANWKRIADHAQLEDYDAG